MSKAINGEPVKPRRKLKALMKGLGKDPRYAQNIAAANFMGLSYKECCANLARVEISETNTDTVQKGITEMKTRGERKDRTKNRNEKGQKAYAAEAPRKEQRKPKQGVHKVGSSPLTSS